MNRKEIDIGRTEVRPWAFHLAQMLAIKVISNSRLVLWALSLVLGA